MSYNYKYSTFGERERIARIRGGDEDVYKTEKALNARLKRDRIEAGLPTYDIDDWDAKVDSARNTALKKAKNDLKVKYGSASLVDINNAARQSFKDLRKQRDESVESVKEDAKISLEVLGEWLAANGYSKNGSLATKSKKEIEDALKEALETISQNYKGEVSAIRERLRSYIK